MALYFTIVDLKVVRVELEIKFLIIQEIRKKLPWLFIPEMNYSWGTRCNMKNTFSITSFQWVIRLIHHDNNPLEISHISRICVFLVQGGANYFHNVSRHLYLWRLQARSYNPRSMSLNAVINMSIFLEHVYCGWYDISITLHMLIRKDTIKLK